MIQVVDHRQHVIMGDGGRFWCGVVVVSVGGGSQDDFVGLLPVLAKGRVAGQGIEISGRVDGPVGHGRRGEGGGGAAVPGEALPQRIRPDPAHFDFVLSRSLLFLLIQPAENHYKCDCLASALLVSRRVVDSMEVLVVVFFSISALRGLTILASVVVRTQLKVLQQPPRIIALSMIRIVAGGGE